MQRMMWRRRRRTRRRRTRRSEEGAWSLKEFECNKKRSDLSARGVKG